MHMAQNNHVLWKWNIVKRPVLSASNAAYLQYIVNPSYIFVFPMIFIRWLWNISHELILLFNVYTTKPTNSETKCLYLIISTLSLILCCVTDEQVQINVVVLRFYFIWAVLLEMWCHNGSNFVWKKLFQHFACSLTIMIQ